MATLAVNELRATRTGHFENAMAVVMPLLGYALEIVAKTAWALNDFRRTGAMPSRDDLRDAASYPAGQVPFRGNPIPRGRGGGHAVAPLFEALAERVDNDSAQAFKNLIARPVPAMCLGAVTTFHGFTRYGLLDELLDPARDDDTRFVATVFVLQQALLAEHGKGSERDSASMLGPFEVAERHRREFLPALAAAYWELFAALSEVLADVLSDIDDGSWLATRVRDRIAAQGQN